MLQDNVTNMNNQEVLTLECYTTVDKAGFSKRLYELRRKHDVSQEHLSYILHKGRTTITRWEDPEDVLRPTLDDTVILASLFGVTVDYLLTGISSENNEVHKATGLSEDAISTLRSYKEEKPYLIDALSKALASREFIEAVSSILTVTGESGYYDGCSHSHGEPYYTCTLSPDSYAAYLSARLMLIIDALRKDNRAALKPYPPAEAAEVEFIKNAKSKGLFINGGADHNGKKESE